MQFSRTLHGVTLSASAVKNSLDSSTSQRSLLTCLSYRKLMPSVLWRCWLGGRKGIWPVKTWAVGCWHGYLSGARCSWCHCHSLSLASVKSRLVSPFWYRLTWVVPDKGPLNRCVCVCVCVFLWKTCHTIEKCMQSLRRNSIWNSVKYGINIGQQTTVTVLFCIYNSCKITIVSWVSATYILRACNYTYILAGEA